MVGVTVVLVARPDIAPAPIALPLPDEWVTLTFAMAGSASRASSHISVAACSRFEGSDLIFLRVWQL